MSCSGKPWWKTRINGEVEPERQHVHTKVWFDRIWMVWGKEPAKESHIIDKAWLKQIEPPFYIGRGISIRIGVYSIRIGHCIPQYSPDETEVEDLDREIALSGGRQLGELVTDSKTERVFVQEIRKERLWDSSGTAHLTSAPSASSQTATKPLPTPPSHEPLSESVGSPFLSPSTLPKARA